MTMIFSRKFQELHQLAGFTTQGVNDETLKQFGDLVVKHCYSTTLHSQTAPQAAQRILEYFYND